MVFQKAYVWYFLSGYIGMPSGQSLVGVEHQLFGYPD